MKSATIISLCLFLATFASPSIATITLSERDIAEGWQVSSASIMDTRNVDDKTAYANGGLTKKKRDVIESPQKFDNDEDENKFILGHGSNNIDNGDNGNGDGRRTKPSGNLQSEITFYTGNDLKNSACYGGQGYKSYDAKDNDFIAAMHMQNFEMCFKCLAIKNDPNSVKIVVVKVIDKCAGCPPGKQNIDLTKAAFSQLDNLDVGRRLIVWRTLPECPTLGRWPLYESRK